MERGNKRDMTTEPTIKSTIVIGAGLAGLLAARTPA